eukprot:226930-Rhodomonas_salina.1
MQKQLSYQIGLLYAQLPDERASGVKELRQHIRTTHSTLQQRIAALLAGALSPHAEGQHLNLTIWKEQAQRFSGADLEQWNRFRKKLETGFKGLRVIGQGSYGVQLLVENRNGLRCCAKVPFMIKYRFTRENGE